MSARDAILARIRANQPGGAVSAAPPHPRPGAPDDLVAGFRDRAAALATTLDEVADMAAAPAAVARYLREQGLPQSAVCWPALAGVDWNAAGVAVEARAARAADLVGITGAFCAIAETGTLMTLSGADTPPSVSLLPETHVALVSRARIVAGMEEAWQLLRTERGALPRAVNFISGPSRTADIEQTVILGVHGPYRVHVVLTP